jgi:hypothetical protein
MNSITIDLKEEVRRAVRAEWPAFASSHPRLAAVVDETILIDGAMSALGEDSEYQSTMEQAAAAGIAAEVVGTFVQKVVSQWLRRLV